MRYQIGAVVEWMLGTVTGEAIFIGHPKAAKHDEVLVLATAAQVGIEIDADNCRPTGDCYPPLGQAYRLLYFRQFPGKLQGNP